MDQTGQSIVKAVADDPGVLRSILGYFVASVAAGVSTVGTFIWRHHEKQVADIQHSIKANDEDCISKFSILDIRVDGLERELRNDFTRLEQHNKSQDKVRDDVISLHKKIEDNHREIMGVLLQRRDQSRGDY